MRPDIETKVQRMGFSLAEVGRVAQTRTWRKDVVNGLCSTDEE